MPGSARHDGPRGQGEQKPLSAAAKARPESVGTTSARFLRPNCGTCGKPGTQRVSSNASQKNGPSSTIPPSSPTNLHSSQGIQGSSDWICTEVIRPRSRHKSRRRFSGTRLKEARTLCRHPQLGSGLVGRRANRQPLDVPEEVLEVLIGVATQADRAVRLRLYPSAGSVVVSRSVKTVSAPSRA